MKKPHFFKKIVLSINSKPFYTTILHEHFMKSFLYLMLLSLIISLPFSLYTSIKTSSLFEDIIDEFPAFYFEESEFRLQDEQPFIYKGEGNELIIIADTTGAYGFNDLVGYETGILISTKSFVLSQAGILPQTVKYSEMMILPSNDVLDLIVDMRPFIILMSTLFSLFFSFLFICFKSLFSCSLAFFIKNSLGLKLTFSQTYKIAIYSLTAPLVFVEILNFIPSQLVSNISFGLFVFINVVYLIQILRYMKNQKTDVSI